MFAREHEQFFKLDLTNNIYLVHYKATHISIMTPETAIHDKLTEIINKGESLNLEYRDCVVAGTHVNDGEYFEALNHILEQFYYYERPADQEFYNLIAEAAEMLEVPDTEYEFLKDHIKG